jgi:hypothetical protein
MKSVARASVTAALIAKAMGKAGKPTGLPAR